MKSVRRTGLSKDVDRIMSVFGNNLMNKATQKHKENTEKQDNMPKKNTASIQSFLDAPAQEKKKPEVSQLEEGSVTIDHYYFTKIRLFMIVEEEIKPDRYFFLKYQHLISPEDRSSVIKWLMNSMKNDVFLSKHLPFFETINLFDRSLSNPSFPPVSPQNIKHLMIGCLNYVVRNLGSIIPGALEIEVEATLHQEIKTEIVLHFEKWISKLQISVLPHHLSCSHSTSLHILSGYFSLNEEEIEVSRSILEDVVIEMDCLMFSHMVVVLTITTIVMANIRLMDCSTLEDSINSIVDLDTVARCANCVILPVLHREDASNYRSVIWEMRRSTYNFKGACEVEEYSITRKKRSKSWIV